MATTQHPRAPLNAPLPVEGVTSANGSRLFTAAELGGRWQVPKAQVYRLAREGVLPTIRIGRYRRFSMAAVEAFEQAGGGSTDA